MKSRRYQEYHQVQGKKYSLTVITAKHSMHTRGGNLSKDYEILPKDCIHKSQDKLLNLCNIECHGDHDPDHIQQKPHRMATSVRKTILSKAIKFMNNAKILSITSNTPVNQVQSTSTRFAPNFEAIQNALKYDRKLHYPSILEFEKVCSIMNTYEIEGTVISKQYGIKYTQDPKDQAVLLGVVSTIMPELLDKYPDFLARSQDQEEFDQWKTTLLDAKKFQAAIGSTSLATAEAIASYFQVHWFGKWMLGKWRDFGKKKASLQQNQNYNEKKINEQEKLLYKKNLVQEIDQNTWNVTQFASTSIAIQYATAELEADIDDASKKNESESRSLELKITGSIDEKQWLCITRRNEKFACPCGFNVISDHDCQNIVAVHLFIDKSEFRSKTKLQRSIVESVISSSLESYLRQKDTNGHAQNEFKLSQRRGPKNKRKNQLMPGESIQLRDTILNKPYHKVQINEIIGNSKIIVDITFENGSIEQCIIQLADIIRYVDGPMKKQIISSFKDSYGNVVVPTMPYGEKKGELQLTCICPVNTSLILIQSVFLTYKNIHKHAATFAEADQNSQTCHLLQLAKTRQVNLFGGLSEYFFEQFFHDSLDQNILVVKSTVTT
ncbi:8726_t:CDS:10, partial [Ambispora gerdemannii]